MSVLTGDPDARALAGWMVDLDRRVRDMERTDQLAHSSIENGAIAAYVNGQLTMLLGQQFDGTNGSVVVNGPTPPPPLAPSVAASASDGLTVTWHGGFQHGAYVPMDFARVGVYVLADPEDLNLSVAPAASITSPQGGTVFVPTPPDVEYHVVLVTWSNSGKPSSPSPAVTGTAFHAPTQAEVMEIVAEQIVPAESIPRHRVFRQSIEPDEEVLGKFLQDDIWFDTGDDNRMYIWDGAWLDAGQARAVDFAAAQALAQQAADDAAAAFDFAQSAVQTWRQTAAPTYAAGARAGHLWWNDDKVVHRASGTSDPLTWTPLQDQILVDSVALANSTAGAAQTAASNAASAVSSLSTTVSNNHTAALDAALDAKAEAIEAAEDYADSIAVGAANLWTGGGPEQGSGNFFTLHVADLFEDMVGETITLSYDVKAAIPGTINGPYPYQGSGHTIADADTTPVTTQWVRHSWTTTVVSNPIPGGYSQGEIAWYDSNVAQDLRFRNIKIERGNKATDWSPSSGDQAAAIASALIPVNSALSALNTVDAGLLGRFPLTSVDIGNDAVLAPHIGANQVTTEHLTVASVGDNIILNGNFRDLVGGPGSAPYGWSSESNAHQTIASMEVGNDTYLMVQRTASAGYSSVFQSGTNGLIPVTQGDQFHVEIGSVTSGGGHQFEFLMHIYDRDNNYIDSAVSQVFTTGNSATDLPAWNRRSAVLTVPAGPAARVRFSVRAITPSVLYYFDKFIVGKVTVSARIADGAVIAAKVAAKAITTEKLTVGSLGDELVFNGNFGDAAAVQTPSTGNPTMTYPAGWWWSGEAGGDSYGFRQATNDASGGFRLIMRATPTVHSRMVSRPFPVAGGKTYAAVARMGYGGQPPAAYFRVGWHSADPGDAGGGEGDLPYTDITGGNLLVGAGDTASTLLEIAGQVTAPAGARFATVIFYNYFPTGGTSWMYVDDVSVRRVIVSTQIAENGVTTTNLSADAITAKHTMIAPTFKTTATASRGILINGSGLVAYSDGSISGVPAGTATLTIDGATGSILMRGSLTSGSSVTGATVTGGTVQTESTAARGIKINSTGLAAYDGSGNPTFTVLAATGAVSTTGAVLSGGSVTGATLQTVVTAQRGIKITGSSLLAYDSTPGSPTLGQAKVTIDGSTGLLTVSGAVQSGGSISGATVTGGTLETESTAARGIKINSAGLAAYNSSGAARFTIDAATGDVVLLGNLTGGGSITGPLFQTDAAATTGVKISNAGMFAYGAANAEVFALDGGNVRMTGGLVTGGHINGATVTVSGADALIQTSGEPMRGVKLTESGMVAYDSVTGSPTLGQPTFTVDSATGAVDLLGKLTATSLTVLNGLAVRGSNNYVQSTLLVQNSIPPPSAAPTLAYWWGGPPGAPLVNQSGLNWGFCPHPTDSNLFLYLASDSEGGGSNQNNKMWLRSVHKTTGVVTSLRYWEGGQSGGGDALWMRPNGGNQTTRLYGRGITMVAGRVYVYLTWIESGNAQNGRLRRLTTNFSDYDAEVTVPSTTLGGSVVPAPALGPWTSGSDVRVMLAHATGTDGIRVVTYAQHLDPASITDTTFATFPGHGNPSILGCYFGNADWGAPRYVFALSGNANFVTDASGNRLNDDYKFPQAGQSTTRGLTYGGTTDADATASWWSHGTNGGVYEHGKNLVTEHIKVGYSWADRDPGGTGTHETTVPAAATSAISRPPRTMLIVEHPTAPQSGVAGQTDAATMTGVYAQTAASLAAAQALATTALRLQDQAKAWGNPMQSLGYSGVDTGATNDYSGVTVTRWNFKEPVKTTGTAPKVSNEFDTVALPGLIQSGIYVADTNGWQLKGDGSAQIGRLTIAADGAVTGGGDICVLQEGLTFMAANTWTHTSGMTVVPSPGGQRGTTITATGGVITVSVAGWYEIGGRVSTSGGAVRSIMRVVAGSNPDANVLVMTEGYGGGGAIPALQGSTVAYLAAGTQLRQYLYMTSAQNTDFKRMWVRAV